IAASRAATGATAKGGEPSLAAAAPSASALPSASSSTSSAVSPAPSSSRQISVKVPDAASSPDAAKSSGGPAAPAPPSSLELRDQRIARYAQQAKTQQAKRDFAGLARTCQRWADEDWRDPRAFYCAGIGLQGIGRHRDAIAMFNRAGALVPR